MNTTEQQLTTKALNLNLRESRLPLDSTDLSLIQLCELTLGGEVNGSVGKNRDDIFALFYSLGDNSRVDPLTMQSLFEQSYNYGLSIDQQGYSDEALETIERLSSLIFSNEFGLPTINETESLILPEDTTSDLVKLCVNNNELAIRVYLRGFCSGVIARNSSLMETVASLDLNLGIEESKMFLYKRNLVESILSNPTSFLNSLIPDIKSLKDLENIREVLMNMLPDYIVKRIGNIKKGKSLTKSSKDGKIVSFWAKEIEDPNVIIAEELLSTSKEEARQSKYQVAGYIGELNLMREVLERDISNNNIPLDIDNLINIFLTTLEVTNSLSKEDLYKEFNEFISSQFNANFVGKRIERYMKGTKYWSLSERSQIVTPDTYEINTRQLRQIERINSTYSKYMQVVVNLYNEAVRNFVSDQRANLLVRKLEGGLVPELIPICRQLMRMKGKTDSLRFDLIPDENGSYWVGEAQIISGGTPPAVLYRNAFESLLNDENYIGRGVLTEFVNKVERESPNETPIVAILYSDRPYSSDISKTTSWAGNLSFIDELRKQGINARYCFSSDIRKGIDGKLYFTDGEYKDVPITTIYNRADYVSPKAVSNLTSKSMQDIIQAIESNDVNIFPSPLPILFGKGIYALIWDPDFEDLLNEKLGKDNLRILRSVTPPTFWIDKSTNICAIDPAKWIRKGSYSHATMGLIMGIDSPVAFREAVLKDTDNPYSATIQAYVNSAQPRFRVLKKYKLKGGGNIKVWVPEGYRLRVEPTSIDGKLCEVFVTGNKEAIVHGRSSSVMTVSTLI